MDMTRAQLSDYVNSLNVVSRKGREEFTSNLWAVWESTGHDMDSLHDAVTMLAPAVARKYGGSAFAISADLWQTIYTADTGKRMDARRPTVDVDGTLRSSVRYAFRDGADTDPEKAIDRVGATVARVILDYARQTQRQSTTAANRRGEHGEWARVPTGDKTCAFCLMLASRGFVYRSEETAGGLDPDSYHDDCDCEVVSRFDGSGVIEGYDPSEYMAMYKAARDNTPVDASRRAYESLDPVERANYKDFWDHYTKDILSSMRGMYGTH